jgi:S-adenosylmethionine decarboxylase
MENCGTQGVHYIVNFFGCDEKQLDSLDFWQDVLPSSVAKTSISVLHSHFYKFEPQGITGFLLLSASHISIHTWPEKNYVACDVFTCSTEEETKSILDYLKNNLTHTKAEVKKINRAYAAY